MNFLTQIVETLKIEQKKNPRTFIDNDIMLKFFANNLVKKTNPITPIKKPVDFSHNPIPAKNSIQSPISIPTKITFKDKSLQDLQLLIKDCQNCKLANFRHCAVVPVDTTPVQIMIIAETPSADDDISGKLFSGDIGELLDKMLNAMTISREKTYCTSLVKCRPPGNRKVEDDEIQSCSAYIRREIELIKPQVIIAFGAGFAKQIMKKNETITNLRGKFDAFNGIPVMSTFSPAFLLRKPSAKREVWNDLQQVMKLLNL